MTRVIFNTATTLNGFLADDEDSLSWLFAVPGADDAESAFGGFLEGVGCLVMGSTTYKWLLEHENLLEHPEKWFYAGKPAFVLSRGRCRSWPGPTSGSAPVTWRSSGSRSSGLPATATCGLSAAATSWASSRMPGCSTR